MQIVIWSIFILARVCPISVSGRFRRHLNRYRPPKTGILQITARRWTVSFQKENKNYKRKVFPTGFGEIEEHLGGND